MIRINRFKLIKSPEEVTEDYKLYYICPKIKLDTTIKEFTFKIKQNLECFQNIPAGLHEGYISNSVYPENVKDLQLSEDEVDHYYNLGLNPLKFVSNYDAIFMWGQQTTISKTHTIIIANALINILDIIINAYDFVIKNPKQWFFERRYKWLPIEVGINYQYIRLKDKRSLDFIMIDLNNLENLQKDFEYYKNMFCEK